MWRWPTTLLPLSLAVLVESRSLGQNEHRIGAVGAGHHVAGYDSLAPQSRQMHRHRINLPGRVSTVGTRARCTPLIFKPADELGCTSFVLRLSIIGLLCRTHKHIALPGHPHSLRKS